MPEQVRQPSGTPTGGRFAPAGRVETASTLTRFDDGATDVPDVDAAGRPVRFPDEWSELTGIEIADPDGWRGGRLGHRNWHEQLTRDEFIARAQYSTVRRWPNPLLDDTGPAADLEPAAAPVRTYAAEVNARMAALHDRAGRAAVEQVWQEARSQFDSIVEAGELDPGSEMGGLLACFENALDQHHPNI